MNNKINLIVENLKSLTLVEISQLIKEIEITPEIRQKDFDNYNTTDDHGMHIVGIAKDQNGHPIRENGNLVAAFAFFPSEGGCLFGYSPIGSTVLRACLGVHVDAGDRLLFRLTKLPGNNQ